MIRHGYCKLLLAGNLQSYGRKNDRQSAGCSEPGFNGATAVSPDIEDVVAGNGGIPAGSSPSGHDGVALAGRNPHSVGIGIRGNGTVGTGCAVIGARGDIIWDSGDCETSVSELITMAGHEHKPKAANTKSTDRGAKTFIVD